MKKTFCLMILIFFCICSLFAQNDNNSSDIDIFQKYEKLKNACISGADSQTITLYQQELHLALEKEIEFNNFPVTLNIYNLKQMLLDMQNACQNLDMEILTNLMASYYFSKNKISQQSNKIFLQITIFMGFLILIVMFLLIVYQFTYAKRKEAEKILMITNNTQDEERRRIALELHDSVAQQMRYVSILADKISDKKLAAEIKKNQSDCIENLRNACYTLSSLDMDKGQFSEALKISIDAFQKRSGISTSITILPEVNFNLIDKKIFHHLFRVIMEILSNIQKHSKANEVTLLIRNACHNDKIHKGVIIFISDDGKGLDENFLKYANSSNGFDEINQQPYINKGDNLKHFGLQNIKIRLKEIGGSITYLSEEGEGTTVIIALKL